MSQAPAGAAVAGVARCGSSPSPIRLIGSAPCLHDCRLQRLSLVCKEWHQLCATPSLVSKVALQNVSGSDALQRMRSLQEWLARHAAHVEQLSLHFDGVGEHEAELLQLVAAAAASCGPRLWKLEIRVAVQERQLILGGWLCRLTGLTQLRVVADEVFYSVSLAGLTALKRLTCVAHTMEHPTGRWLPPNLTTLGWGPIHLPEQVNWDRPLLLGCHCFAAALLLT